MGKENKRLLRLIRKYELTSWDVAELCKVTESTAQKWRQTEGGTGYRNMPPGYLELLKYELGEKKWPGSIKKR